MAWKERCVMDERVRFLADVLKKEWSMAELCRRYGISRRVGYKRMERYRNEGADGLYDRSRAPLSHPQSIDESIVERIVVHKRKHLHWGPRKILASLERLEPTTFWPVASTIGEILDRHGLVQRRKKRRKASPSSQPLAHCTNPNDVWCIDFKGWFLTKNGTRCDPLTLCDGTTRFFLKCQALPGKTDTKAYRLCWKWRSANTESPAQFAAITVPLLPPLGAQVCRDSPCGGCDLELRRNEFARVTPKKTVASNACTKRSKLKQQSRHDTVFANSNTPSTASGKNTITNARTKHWVRDLPANFMHHQPESTPVACLHPPTTTTPSMCAK